MAVVLYKCDTCKREIQKIRRPKGIEVASRCIITLGCRGKLYQLDLYPDFIRAELPAGVIGLTDYQQRKVVYNHTQTRASKRWTIEHNMGTAPVVSVFVSSPTLEDPTAMEEITPVDIVTINADITVIVFAESVSGVAQLVARSTDPQLLTPTVNNISSSASVVQITANNTITVATRVNPDGNEPPEVGIQFKFTTPTGTDVIFTMTVGGDIIAGSPWSSSNRVLIRGKIYKVRALDPVSVAVLSGVVPSGSTFCITGISLGDNPQSISTISQARVGFILLAEAPYANIDKLNDSVVDFLDVSCKSATQQIILQGLDLYATPESITNIHPPIRSL